MSRKVTANELGGMKTAVTELEKSIRKLSSELDAFGERDGVEMTQAYPLLCEASTRLSAAWSLLQENLSNAPSRYVSLWQAATDSFATRISVALADKGWQVIGDPTRPVVEGIVFLSVDSAKPEVKVNGTTVKDLTVGAIVALTAEALERIKSQRTAVAPFLSALERAYDDQIGSSAVQTGGQVHVSAVYQRLLLGRQSKAFVRDCRVENFREYPMEAFRADLYQALNGESVTPSGRRLHVASGSDTDGAIFMVVPSLGRTGYVGRLWFER